MKLFPHPVIWMTVYWLGSVSLVNGATYFSETFTSGFQGGGTIPDGDLNGWADLRTVPSAGGIWEITDLRVTLEVSGGFNGDLYGYICHEGESAVLLNRVGVGEAKGDSFGYDNNGFDITFSAAGSENVHFYQDFSVSYDETDRLTGIWQPDGRDIDPLSVPSAFDNGSTEDNFNQFTGLDPAGEWTLYIADVSSGGGQAQTMSWGLEIDAVFVSAQAVPETRTFFAAIFLAVWTLGRFYTSRPVRVGEVSGNES